MARQQFFAHLQNKATIATRAMCMGWTAFLMKFSTWKSPLNLIVRNHTNGVQVRIYLVNLKANYLRQFCQLFSLSHNTLCILGGLAPRGGGGVFLNYSFNQLLITHVMRNASYHTHWEVLLLVNECWLWAMPWVTGNWSRIFSLILPQCSTQLLQSNFLLMITVAATLYPGDASTELKPMM